MMAGLRRPAPSLEALKRMNGAALTALFAGDPAIAAPWVRLAAEQGIPEAQLRWGRMLLEGHGMPRDEAAAFGWFAAAAQSGDPEALNMLGRAHENGWGVPADTAKAATYYRRAAERGDPWAQYNLGHLLLDGNGVTQDWDAAFHWYGQAAAQGHGRAMNLLGRCCEEGWGTPPDPVAAVDWYRRSAETGYFRGQYNYASALLAAGRAEAAAIWFARAAVGGNPAVTERATAALRAVAGPASSAARCDCPSGEGSDAHVLPKPETLPHCRGHGAAGPSQHGIGHVG